MSDQCRKCMCFENFEECEKTPCYIREDNWICRHLRVQRDELHAEVKELREWQRGRLVDDWFKDRWIDSTINPADRTHIVTYLDGNEERQTIDLTKMKIGISDWMVDQMMPRDDDDA